MEAHVPRIGITCDFTVATDRRGSPCPQYVLQEAYVAAVERAGGEPWLLPHLGVERVGSVIEVVDGLLLTGGDFDIPASFYDEEPRHIRNSREERSAFERGLVLAAYEGDVPLLGVCGGMQMLNVALGGSLYQDLSERRGCLDHQQQQERHLPCHLVTVRPDSVLSGLVGAGTVEVNSTHHQIVKKLGQNVMASGAAPDGVVEAIEICEKRFMVGVQWHPEAFVRERSHQSLYRGLVQAAKERLSTQHAGGVRRKRA